MQGDSRGSIMAKIAVVDEQSSAMERLKSGPARLTEFLKDVRAEMRKVIAPSRPEVISTTTVVVVTVFLFAAYFFLVDSVIGKGVTSLIQHFTNH
jgi:preprotein translocase subunit SecE